MSYNDISLGTGLWSSSNPLLPPAGAARLLVFTMTWELLVLKTTLELQRRDGTGESQNATECVLFLRFICFSWINVPQIAARLVNLQSSEKVDSNHFFFCQFFHCFYWEKNSQRSLLCHFPHLVLICISIMTNNIEPLFMCLCASLILFDKMSAQAFLHLKKIKILVFLSVLRILYILCIQILYQVHV